MIEPTHLTLSLPDGARMAYEILGRQHAGQRQPIVLVGGMSSLRGDWERLAKSLATHRPVLLFDHRGMGDSTFSPGKTEVISLESLARDLFFLLRSTHWKSVSICGFSMGGVVTQQLLFLPFHKIDPTPLTFKVTHVVLAGTFSSPLRDKRYGLKFDRTIPTKPRTREEKREIARPTLEATFDPKWVANLENVDRLNWWLDRQINGRPTSTILMQARAMNRFDFTGLHDKLPKDIQFLVVHGELDAIVPPSCGQEILQRIPWAKSVEVGGHPGQVEDLNFGHHWYEYFDIQVWNDVVEYFLEPNPVARL